MVYVRRDNVSVILKIIGVVTNVQNVCVPMNVRRTVNALTVPVLATLDGMETIVPLQDALLVTKVCTQKFFKLRVNCVTTIEL
jgi:hypothetical protein